MQGSGRSAGKGSLSRPLTASEPPVRLVARAGEGLLSEPYSVNRLRRSNVDRQVKLCDRCKVEITGPPYYHFTISYHHPKTLDICFKCEKEFHTWLGRNPLF